MRPQNRQKKQRRMEPVLEWGDRKGPGQSARDLTGRVMDIEIGIEVFVMIDRHAIFWRIVHVSK